MPHLPDHEACKRCGDDLTGFLRAIGVCGRCMQTPALPTQVPNPVYGWRVQPRLKKETLWQKKR
jgi:hypothetical protein